MAHNSPKEHPFPKNRKTLQIRSNPNRDFSALTKSWNGCILNFCKGVSEMVSPSSRNIDVSILHPVFRDKVLKLKGQLQVGNHPFELFESCRSPERQSWLYAQGRTRSGSIVTRARAFESYHQYGLAVDMVLKINGNWSWDTSGANAAHWKALHAIADDCGLEPLSFELPHLQMKGLQIAALKRGEYPAFGDDDWAENLAAMILDWKGGGAPPPPSVPDRPTLTQVAGELSAEPAVEQKSEDDDTINRSATPQADSRANTMATQSAFEAIQSMIDKWEGGYVDHPSDPGGATNMGITLATLARWRGHPVTKSDVKSLTRQEQRQIMKSYYYNVISGDSLAPGVAAVTYNAAILHGPKRAATFLQSAIARFDPSIEIDGAIGPATAAAARLVPIASLVNIFIEVELSFLRGLSTWPVFGKGWENRLVDIRNFALGLDQQLGSQTVGPTPEEGNLLPSPNIIPSPPAGQPKGMVGIDNILGETIGNALSGKKTAIGGIGTLATFLVPVLGKALNVDTAQIDQIVQFLQPLSVALLSWGVGGKIDKMFGGLFGTRL